MLNRIGLILLATTLSLPALAQEAGPNSTDAHSLQAPRNR